MHNCDLSEWAKVFRDIYNSDRVLLLSAKCFRRPSAPMNSIKNFVKVFAKTNGLQIRSFGLQLTREIIIALPLTLGDCLCGPTTSPCVFRLSAIPSFPLSCGTSKSRNTNGCGIFVPLASPNPWKKMYSLTPHHRLPDDSLCSSQKAMVAPENTIPQARRTTDRATEPQWKGKTDGANGLVFGAYDRRAWLKSFRKSCGLANQEVGLERHFWLSSTSRRRPTTLRPAKTFATKYKWVGGVLCKWSDSWPGKCVPDDRCYPFENNDNHGMDCDCLLVVCFMLKMYERWGGRIWKTLITLKITLTNPKDRVYEWLLRKSSVKVFAFLIITYVVQTKFKVDCLYLYKQKLWLRLNW